MLKFGPHLIGLLVELLYLYLSRPDVSLKLLDLVIEHKLELLQLLGLFLKLENSLILIADCSLALTYFLSLSVYLGFHRVNKSHVLVNKGLLLLNLPNVVVTFKPGLLEAVHGLSQFSLMGHPCLNNPRQFIFIAVLDRVNAIPKLVVMLLPLL